MRCARLRAGASGVNDLRDDCTWRASKRGAKVQDQRLDFARAASGSLASEAVAPRAVHHAMCLRRRGAEIGAVILHDAFRFF